MPETSNERWGSDWTKDKLARFEKYIKAYMQIMTRNPRAQVFRTHYVDAFAGTGYIVIKDDEKKDDLFFDEYFEEAVDAYIKGSARLALELEKPFDKYLFIEKNKQKSKELESLRKEYPNLATRITIETGDANDELSSWCDSMKRNDRAVVFLDPYGMQVEWRLLEKIAKTESIDLWILFPLSGVIRMLRRDGQIPDNWRERLTIFFGTNDWEKEFYKTSGTRDMFDDQAGMERDVKFDSIKDYFVKRLETIFPYVLKKPLVLKNHHGTPLFLLAFAAGNKIGGKTALKIAKDLLKE